MRVHGNNIHSKINQSAKYKDEIAKTFLVEIKEKYSAWLENNETLKGPFSQKTEKDKQIIKKRVEIFNDYKDFIDQQKYAEKFDSRSNLHSSVLEEFLEHLFIDMVSEIDSSALIGKSHSFKDVFFKSSNFATYLSKPEILLEKKDHDFIIGVSLDATFQTKSNNSKLIKKSIELPVIAIECKTYLDKTMLEGASNAANQIKSKNPDALYIVCSEWLKLTDSINLKKYDVDQIFILRKQKNTDREFRYDPKYKKNPIYDDVVFSMFELVRDHLTNDWSSTISENLEKGKLI